MILCSFFSHAFSSFLVFWHGCQRMVFIFFFTPILSSISFRCVLSFPLLAWCYTYCPSWKIEAKGKGKENRPHFGLNGDKKKKKAPARSSLRNTGQKLLCVKNGFAFFVPMTQITLYCLKQKISTPFIQYYWVDIRNCKNTFSCDKYRSVSLTFLGRKYFAFSSSIIGYFAAAASCFFSTMSH